MSIMDMLVEYCIAGAIWYGLYTIAVSVWAWFTLGRELRSASKVISNDEYINLLIGLLLGIKKRMTWWKFLIDTVLWPWGVARETYLVMEQIEDTRETVRERMKELAA